MMEENKDIFLASDDALGYLVGPMHKKYSMIFIWVHSFSRCGSYSYDQFFDPSHLPTPHHPLCAHMYAFRVPPPFAYVILSIWCPLFPFWLYSFVKVSKRFSNLWLTLSKLYVSFVSDTHHFLVSHSVPSSLPRKAFSLMVASNRQLFYLS